MKLKKVIRKQNYGRLTLGCCTISLVQDGEDYFVVQSQGTSRSESVRTKSLERAEKWFFQDSLRALDRFGYFRF